MLIFRKIKSDVKLRRISRSKQGKAFEHLTAAGLKYIVDNSDGNVWYQRLFDYQAFVAVNSNLHCIKQPGDYMALAYGRFYIIECKSSTMPRFMLENVKPHQEEAMQLMEDAGGFHWLLLMHRDASKHRNHQFYALNRKGWEAVKKLTAAENKKSASWQVIEDCASFCLTRAHGVLDLSSLFQKRNVDRIHLVKSRSDRRLIFMRRPLKKRDIRFILMQEMPMVAFFDRETDEIFFIVDLWAMKLWESWRNFINERNEVRRKNNIPCNLTTPEQDLNQFLTIVMIDANTSVLHELFHAYAGEDEDSIPVFILEQFVEYVASTLSHDPMRKLSKLRSVKVVKR